MKCSQNWKDDNAVYQIFVDRFNNGDGSNDKVNLPSFNGVHQLDEMNSGNLKNVHLYRHGGDLQGIINRLEYLRILGISTLWLTPVFENNAGESHGYCVSNFLKIDPAFGDVNKMRELVQKAHAKGIKVVIDIAINHMCDKNSFMSKRPSDRKMCAQVQHNNVWQGTVH
jgi:glycosidase